MGFRVWGFVVIKKKKKTSARPTEARKCGDSIIKERSAAITSPGEQQSATYTRHPALSISSHARPADEREPRVAKTVRRVVMRPASGLRAQGSMFRREAGPPNHHDDKVDSDDGELRPWHYMYVNLLGPRVAKTVRRVVMRPDAGLRALRLIDLWVWGCWGLGCNRQGDPIVPAVGYLRWPRVDPT